MRKIILVAVLLLPLVVIADDFRNNDWGDSKEQVKNSELFSVVAINDDDRLLFKGTISGIDFLVGYDFLDDMLVSGGILNQAQHVNKYQYILDYKNIQKILVKLYGKPKKEQENWHNDLFRNEEVKRGLAISLGHLDYITEWLLKKTKITHALLGADFNITHIIQYEDLSSINKAKDRSEKEIMDQL